MELNFSWAVVLLLSAGLIGGCIYLRFLSNQLKERDGQLEQLKGQVLEWNRRLEGTVSEQTGDLEVAHKKLQETYLETVTSLVEAINAKDKYLFGHSHNVARFARLIATEMTFSKSQMERLVHGCELHDLGKIAIPDSVLSKPGPLTDEEYEIIKQHPGWGARILEPLTFMKDIMEMVHQEHERFDGSGYPRALKGEKIRLEARIIAVADALDAMVSDRPYRKRMPLETAMKEIKRCSGTQFDPQVVTAALKAYEKGTLSVKTTIPPKLGIPKLPSSSPKAAS